MTRPFKFDGQRPFVGQLCFTPSQWKHPSLGPTYMHYNVKLSQNYGNIIKTVNPKSNIKRIDKILSNNHTVNKYKLFKQ